jgi:hypothetical protein
MVVKLKSQGDLDKETREYEKTHKKKVEKAKHDGKEGAQLPRRTNVPEMTYGCGCASMFTYGTCIAATSCHACKERGSVTETDGKPNCNICSCACVIGAFKQSEIVELRIRRLQEQESAAKAANAPKDDIFSRANASLANMMKQSVMEAAKNISQSSSDPSMKNIVSATASAMSRKQPESEEILYNLQRRQGAPSTRLKHTGVCVRELLGSGLGGDEKGTRYYQNRLSQAGFGSSGVICLDETSPGDGGGKLPAGGGVQETDDLWIQEFMNRDESEDLEDWERDILGEYIALIPAVTEQTTTTTPPTKKQRCRLLTKQGFQDRTVHQLTERMIEGTPLTQRAAVGVISNLSSSSNNASKIILKSAINRDATLPGMSQETAKKLVTAEKIYMNLSSSA